MPTLTGTLDATLLQMGPGNVYYNGKLLGYMGDQLAVTIETTVTPLTGAQAGSSPLDKVVTGGRVHVAVPLKEINLRHMATGVLNAILVTGATSGMRLDIKNRVGLSARSLAKELRIIKLVGTGSGFNESTDPADTIVMPLASPADSQVVIPFAPTTQREITVTFECWPDSTTGRWAYMGSELAAAFDLPVVTIDP